MAADKNAGRYGSANKNKANRGGGKDSNTGGRPSQQSISGGNGNTSGSRGTKGS